MDFKPNLHLNSSGNSNRKLAYCWSNWNWKEHIIKVKEKTRKDPKEYYLANMWKVVFLLKAFFRYSYDWWNGEKIGLGLALLTMRNYFCNFDVYNINNFIIIYKKIKPSQKHFTCRWNTSKFFLETLKLTSCAKSKGF